MTEQLQELWKLMSEHREDTKEALATEFTTMDPKVEKSRPNLVSYDETYSGERNKLQPKYVQKPSKGIYQG